MAQLRAPELQQWPHQAFTLPPFFFRSQCFPDKRMNAGLAARARAAQEAQHHRFRLVVHGVRGRDPEQFLLFDHFPEELVAQLARRRFQPALALRGVRAPGTRTITSRVTGVLRDDATAREEFLARCATS